MRSKKAIVNFLTSLLLQIIVIIYGFIVPKIIISSFGSIVNGLVSSITQFLGYINVLDSGFGYVVKSLLYKPIAEKNKEKIGNILYQTEKFFRKIAIIFIIYIVGLCIIYPMMINDSFSKVYTISLIVIISIGTFAEYFFGMTYRLFLQADQKSYVVTIIQISTYMLSLACIIIIANLGGSIQLLKLAGGLIYVLRPLLQNAYVKKKYKISFKNVDKNFKIKNKWDGLAQHIAAMIHKNTDVTILTIFCNLAEVSVYSVYFMIVSGIKSFVNIFSDSIRDIWGDMLAKGEYENLNKKFSNYEVIYNSLCVVIFLCTFLLIVPFVQVYTDGVNDVNYMRYDFAFLFVLSEFIAMIRVPYSSIVQTAGHFKETQKGAWVEAIVNIVLSVILVKQFGLIGVTIGTIVAMTIRTIEFSYHSSKYIIKRNVLKGFSKPFISVIEILILYFCLSNIKFFEITNYLAWFIYAIIIFVISTVLVGTINIIIYRKDFKEIKEFGISLIKRK